MKLNFKKIVFGLLILSTKNSHSLICIAKIDKTVVEDLKKDIVSEISRAKYLRYGLGSLLATGLLYKARNVIANRSVVPLKLDGGLDIDVLSAVSELYRQGKLGVINSESLSKKFMNFLSSASSTIVSTLPFVFAQPALEWFFAKNNIPWVVKKTNIHQILQQLKMDSATLDPYSAQLTNFNEKLTINEKNAEALAANATLADLIELNFQAESSRSNPLSDNQRQELIKEMETLSNDFISGIGRIIAFLDYKTECLVKEDKADKAQEIRSYKNDLQNGINEFCDSILPKLELLSNSNSMVKSDIGLLSIIIKYQNYFVNKIGMINRKFN